jgi:hypothetical protein
MLLENMAVSTPYNKAIDMLVTAPDGISSHPPPHDGRDSQNSLGHRRSATVGYIAPMFDGREKQMTEGECVRENEDEH